MSTKPPNQMVSMNFISANKNVFGNMLRELKLSSLITKISWDTLEALNISNTNIQPGQLYHLIVRSHVTNFNKFLGN